MPLRPSGRRAPLWRFVRLAIVLTVAATPARLGTPSLAQTSDVNGDTAAASGRGPADLNFANGLLRERRYELAAKEYERFLQDAKPATEADEARFGLASARLLQGEYAKARQQFEAFLRQAPDNAKASTAWYRLGETSYMLNDMKGARQAFETFVANAPGHKHLETAWPYLGDVCLNQGDLPRAREAYERSLKDFPSGRLADRSRFGLGRSLAAQGDNDAALDAFRSLAETGGKDWAHRAWFHVGQLQARAGRYEPAVAAFEKVETVSPQSPLVNESRLNRAEALAKLGRRDEAEALLKALAADAPQNLAAQATFALGSGRLDAGDPAGALAALDEAGDRYARTPLSAALNFRAAEALQALNRPADARARFLKAAADPKSAWADDALARAARLALDGRDPADAAKLAETFLATFPDSPLKADVRLVSARAASAQGRHKDAIATLTASLAADKPSPATAEAERYYLGLAYRADGQPDKAADVLGGLAKTPAAPVAADAQFLIGQGHIEAKRYGEAVAALEAYLAAKPDGEVADFALAHLVQAKLETGDADGASKALEQLAAKFPKSKNLPPSRVRVAERALADKQFDRATEQFGLAAAEAKGTDPALASRARLGLGWAQLDGGKPADAAGAFAAFLTDSPDDPLAPEAALAKGRALEAAGQTDDALAAYDSATVTYAKSDAAPLAALARARLLVAAKRPAEAADAYAKFDADHPKYAPKDPNAPGPDAVLSEWGWALVDADKPAEADKVFARLLETYPESPQADDARFNLAESANQAGDRKEVVRLLTPLVAPGSKASPRLLQSALYRLGRTQAEEKDGPAASATIDRLLADFPDGPYRREAGLLRAEVSLDAGDAAAADAALAALAAEPPAESDPPGFTAAVRRKRVQSLLALKKWKDVIEAADALKDDAADGPPGAEVEYARGRALQQLARFDEARAAYRKVIGERKAGDLVARAQLMIGETFFHQKDYHEAIREFLRVDVLHNDAPTWQAAALLEAGKAYEQLALWPDAAETYERLRAKFPGDPASAEAKSRLDAVRPRLGTGKDRGETEKG